MARSSLLFRAVSLTILLSFLLGACSGVSEILPIPENLDEVEKPAVQVDLPPTPTPFLPLPPTNAPVDPTAVPSPPAPQPELALWAAPYLPAPMIEALQYLPGLKYSGAPERAAIRLEAGGQSPVSQWIYALVAPFPTLVDEVGLDDVQGAWRGAAGGPFFGSPLLMDESTYGVFTVLWGMPTPGAVQVVTAGEMLAAAWNKEHAWAILPFEALEPRWKVLSVDGQSPVRKDFDPAAYPLAVPFSLSVTGEGTVQDIAAAVRQALPATNRMADRLTTVVLTGVTALVRATAFSMEREGITSPAADVGDWLREADITHISNEIPFTVNCPYPNPSQEGLVFCSRPQYIELMEAVGTDVVELTGDHFADWGPEAMYETLEMYQERNWPYYGGGENLEDGRKAVLFEHNGNRIAFIGCNGKGGGYATARADNPGAVACDYSWFEAEVARLRQEGFLPIFTFQHLEIYTYAANHQVREDFLRVAEAGAVIVSGSQAHQPQGMEFYNNSFIHYGLGNMFFDQWGTCTNRACDDAFVDRHVFYNGRYISTELLTMRFVNYARPRPMAADERSWFLETIFNASEW